MREICMHISHTSKYFQYKASDKHKITGLVEKFSYIQYTKDALFVFASSYWCPASA